MSKPRPRALVRTLVVMAALAVALPAAPVRSAPVMRQIPYSYTTKLPLSPTPVQFRFSLVDSTNQVLWSETKSYALKTSKVVKHQLGSVDPVNHPLPEASFNEQLRVRLEYWRKTPAPARWVALATTNLALAPYALWSAASETPGPAGADGLACWDGNGSGACDLGTEDLNTDGACDALDCVGPRGLPGPDGAQGPPGAAGLTGAAGPTGPACWDLDGNALCALPGEDFNGDGACTVLDCGQKCWDLNRNGACDAAAEDLNLDTFCTVLDCAGPQGSTGSLGPAGPQGLQGPPGPSGGLACWDLNSNSFGDPEEDKNLDGFHTALDCTGPAGPAGAAGPTGTAGPQGPAGAAGSAGATGPQGPQGIQGIQGLRGPTGLTGATGTAGFNCWDLNANRTCQTATEDKNLDGVCTVADCTGAKGDKGVPGDFLLASCQSGQTVVWNGAAWECSSGSTGPCTTYYRDADLDGTGVTGDSLCLFAPNGQYTATEGGDADDGNCLVNPDMVWFLNTRTGGLPEWCNNGRDDDLDLATDSACDIYLQSLGTNAQGKPTGTGWFDRDGDGYFTDAAETLTVWFGTCLSGSGFVFDPAPAPDPAALGDCDNLDATVRPGATDSCDGIDQNCDGTDGVPEVCTNAVDEDCDGVADDGCP